MKNWEILVLTSDGHVPYFKKRLKKGFSIVWKYIDWLVTGHSGTEAIAVLYPVSFKQSFVDGPSASTSGASPAELRTNCKRTSVCGEIIEK